MKSVQDGDALMRTALSSKMAENTLLLQHRPRTWNAKGYTYDGRVRGNSYSSRKLYMSKALFASLA